MKSGAERPGAVEAAAFGATQAPLTKRQKQALCLMARKAYAQCGVTGNLDQWRRAQQLAACGKASLREMRQEDYLNVRGHFLNLLGRKVKAFNDFVAAPKDDRNVAWQKLQHECRAAADVIAQAERYVEAIANTRWKTSMRFLTARQLWILTFDLRRNAQRRRKKAELCAVEHSN